MTARFDAEQPQVKIKELGNGKTAVYLCANGKWREEKTDSGKVKYWECDYHEIIGKKEDIPLNEISLNPNDFMDYEIPEKKPVSNEIEEIKRSLAELISKVYEGD